MLFLLLFKKRKHARINSKSISRHVFYVSITVRQRLAVVFSQVCGADGKNRNF